MGFAVARVTIYSIARDCRDCPVSAATVSRAFSRPDLVRPDVRDRILARSRELGYRPNQTARHLTTGRTGMIGLFLPDITNPFFPPLVRTIQQAAAAADMSVLLVDSEERPGVEPGLISRVKAQADGLIVASPRARSRALTDTVAQVPAVLINRRMRGIPNVVCDYVPALIDAGRHLLDQGHRHVALIRGPSASWAGQQRASAVRAWAADAGVQLADLGSYPATHAGGREAADVLMVSRATAAFAYDDLVACGVLPASRPTGCGSPSSAAWSAATTCCWHAP